MEAIELPDSSDEEEENETQESLVKKAIEEEDKIEVSQNKEEMDTSHERANTVWSSMLSPRIEK